MNPIQRRHHHDELVDDIQIRPSLRWSKSEVTGYAWKVSYVLTIKRKGTVIYERAYHRLESVVTHLPWVLKTMFDGTDPCFRSSEWIQRLNDDKHTCAQPGCDAHATSFFKLKNIFSATGEGPLPTTFVHVTAFCNEHSARGDYDNEDSDTNYERIEPPR